MKSRHLFLFLIAALAGCVPMAVSLYEPADGSGTEVGKCGWSNVSATLLERPGVRVTAGFQGSSGIGIYAVGVSVEAGKTLEFESPDLTITSAELESPVSLRFAAAERGNYIPVRRFVGPLYMRLVVIPVTTPRPRQILLSLPSLTINDEVVDVQAVAFRLRTSGALVGLCQ